MRAGCAVRDPLSATKALLRVGESRLVWHTRNVGVAAIAAGVGANGHCGLPSRR